MVLESRGDTGHNAMVGRKVPHPVSTKYHDGTLPPGKRRKISGGTDGDSSRDLSENEEFFKGPQVYRRENSDLEDEHDENEFEGPFLAQRSTELESALPEVETDKHAIEQYEAMRAAGEVAEDLKSRITQRTWVQGKSSIYVDAFNLALETVLEDESHLFDEKELEVFRQWRSLKYEAQYLYVRLDF